ncbi:MAG TPA: non-ribosomal peptide synthetase [Jatrophihabitans sp.]|jgi:amino acid adenylation domain-containing protein|uniref:amino acid adenylation domain-containing protein n=1 Tax=Jatrophihabitans sp. TaxID=1932789 RepID=UPI002EFA7F6C
MTAAPAASSSTITAAFAQIVAARPGAVAVRCDGRSLTYAQLDRRANQLAHHLIQRGVTAEEPVAVVNDHSEALVISLLAILKAGGCYLGVDTRQPAERITAMLAAAGVRILLTGNPRPAVAGVEAVDVSALDLGAQPSTDPAAPSSPAQLAYLAYTSGSTGAPKAAMIPHAAVLRLVSQANFLTVHADDVFVQLAPLAFDASTLEIWAPLLNGATLVVAPAISSVSDIDRLVSRERVSVLWLTAGLFHQYANAGMAGLRGLRCLIAGGDVLAVPSVNRALAELPAVELVNGYGPTENTTFTCCHLIAGSQDERVPIGFPVSGTSVQLLDEDLRPVPDGEVGELCAGGLGLARGYLGRPGPTAERFVPDPSGQVAGGRLYRTGDLARRRADGALEFLGRLDDQLKIRGFRVEPGEVEAALRELPEVTDAAAVAQQARSGRRLVGFAVLAEPGSMSPMMLRRALHGLLPDYAVPAMIVVLDELPLTANGKVDRVALEARSGRSRPTALSSDYRPPRTETEQQVTDTWELLLDMTGIGVDDDFFELGGHSLIAVGITGELSAVSGVNLQARHFYENPTVSELAGLLDELRADQLGARAELAGK